MRSDHEISFKFFKLSSFISNNSSFILKPELVQYVEQFIRNCVGEKADS